MKYRTAVVWGLVNSPTNHHPSLTQKEKTIEGLIPLIDTLFPGINYYSITGFGQVMRVCVIPVLKKRFPELIGVAADTIDPRAELEIAEFLASKGYEWQDSEAWGQKFNALLQA